MMKKVLYAVMSLVIAVTVYGCRNDRKALKAVMRCAYMGNRLHWRIPC